MELTFPIAALIVLCFVFVARMVLITCQCCGHCWAVFLQHEGCLFNTPPSQGQQGGEGQEFGRGHSQDS